MPEESLALETAPGFGVSSAERSAERNSEEEELIPLDTLQGQVAVEEQAWAGVRVINFDETSRKKGHDYVTNFINGQTGELLDVQVGKGAKAVEAFVKKALAKGLGPLQIEEVNID
ncbi:MAG: transposase, partial [Phaeodactylibacter sp.]|nr:transposase [Phaeodactylibacter sp.]